MPAGHGKPRIVPLGLDDELVRLQETPRRWLLRPVGTSRCPADKGQTGWPSGAEQREDLHLVASVPEGRLRDKSPKLLFPVDPSEAVCKGANAPVYDDR